MLLGGAGCFNQTTPAPVVQPVDPSVQVVVASTTITVVPPEGVKLEKRMGEGSRAGSEIAYNFKNPVESDLQLQEILFFTKQSIKDFDAICNRPEAELCFEGPRPTSKDYSADKIELAKAKPRNGRVINDRKFLVEGSIYGYSYITYAGDVRLEIWVTDEIKKATAAEVDMLVGKVTITSSADKPVVKTPTTTPVSAVPFGLKRYINKDVKFQIDHPERWLGGPVEDPDSIIHLEYATRFGKEGPLAIAIVRVSREAGITQDAYTNRLKKTLESFGPKKEGEDYSISAVTLAGQKNVLKFVSTNTKESPRYAETYVLVNNELIYVISYQATDENYKEDLPGFKRMVESFKLN